MSRIKFGLTIYPTAYSLKFYKENNTEHHKRCRANTLYRLEVGLYGLKENNIVRSHFKKQDYLIHHSVSDGNYNSQIPHNP
jgi:hypothetical protein